MINSLQVPHEIRVMIPHLMFSSLYENSRSCKSALHKSVMGYCACKNTGLKRGKPMDSR